MERALAMGRWGRAEPQPAADPLVEPAPDLPQTVEPATREEGRLWVAGSTSAPDRVDARGRNGRLLGQPKSRKARKPRAAAESGAPQWRL
jgi:hypothetical protein